MSDYEYIEGRKGRAPDWTPCQALAAMIARESVSAGPQQRIPDLEGEIRIRMIAAADLIASIDGRQTVPNRPELDGFEEKRFLWTQIQRDIGTFAPVIRALVTDFLGPASAFCYLFA